MLSSKLGRLLRTQANIAPDIIEGGVTDTQDAQGVSFID